MPQLSCIPGVGPVTAPSDGAHELVRRALEAHRRGELNEAAVLYARSLELEPGRFDALHWLGCLRFQQGQLQEARALLGAALEADPASAMAHANLGNVLGAAGDFAAALERFERALSLEPGLVIALIGQAAALNRLGRHAEAVESYDRALRFKPDAGVLSDRAGALVELGRAQEALASTETALTLRPGFVRALINRGNALRILGRPAEALASYDEALAIEANEITALCNRGLVLGDLGRQTEALESLGRALELQRRNPRALKIRGAILHSLGRPHAALADFDDAIAIQPGLAEAHHNRGVVLLELGRLDEASQAIETSIQLAPKWVHAYYNLTTVRRMRAGEPCLRALEDLAKAPEALSGPELIELNFALAKAYADLGDHEAAFSRLLKGNGLKRAETRYDEAATLTAFARAQKDFTPNMIGSWAGHGHPSQVPIFIIGMPRSGTSLVEQVLASHPEVFGAGETDLFVKTVARVLKCGADGSFQLSAPELRELGERYVEGITSQAPGAARITDKCLDNVCFAGLIHLALPNARIIHVRRDPIDTCVSCFSKLFVGELGYTYDLGELGRYYRASEALMDYWRETLPKQTFLEVRYEEIVSDLEGEARRILAHCGLEWDPACLDFHLASRQVRTASAAQVRQPIYRSSIGSWRPYEGRLGPLVDALGL